MRRGSTKVRDSDFRLVCATNKRLLDEVRDGRFREDLYYRINVVNLDIPPLRDRQEDIIPLVIHFLEFFRAKFKKDVGPMTPDALGALERFPWPGNVRQLKHAIERMVALHPGGPVSSADLSDIADDAELVADVDENDVIHSYQRERATFEREYLARLLAEADGNVSEAARMSGISRQNLYVRMKRWELS